MTMESEELSYDFIPLKRMQLPLSTGKNETDIHL